MILESVKVRNFRSIKDATLRCDRLTALVGANGSGKSSFLKAIELFYDSKVAVTDKDYHKNDTKNDITVSLTFADLSAEAAEAFSGYVVDGKLTATREFEWNEQKAVADSAFVGTRHSNPDFEGIRELSAEYAKIRYEELRVNKKYRNFPKLSAKRDIDEQLHTWERNNPGQCTDTVDNSEDFEPKWKKYAGRFSEFIAVPAVHDASDDARDAKNSTLALLMAAVKRQIEDDPTYQKRRKQIMANLMKATEKFEGELDELGESITGIFQKFVSGAKVDLRWSDELPDLGLPKAEVVLEEDGYESTVDRAGHGSQRVLIMAMLQKMAQMRQAEKTEQTGIKPPALILSIEEPELYQHPIRQRHMSAVLSSLAESSNRIQIIYTTHSPHFAGIDKLDRVRLLRKTAWKARETRSTKVHETNVQKLLKRLEPLGVSRSRELMEERLKTIMTPWLNEGFFAEMVVLVEGISDYAAIMGMSRLKEKEFEASGVSVIPCYGINNMPDLFVVFDELEIPTYAVWDLDNGDHKKRESNRRSRCMLQRLFGSEPEGTQIEDGFSCFNTDLEGAIKGDMSKELFDKSLNDQKRTFGMEGQETKQVLAKPRIMYEVLKQAEDAGNPCTTLERIVRRIDSKASQRAGPRGSA